MTWTIAPIVEGHGDRQAVPVLLRKMRPDCKIASPVRFPKSRLVIEPELRRAVLIARANIEHAHLGMILLILDADADCPATNGPRLLAIMRAATPNVECYVAMAKREFESWIIGGDERFGVEEPETAGSPKQRVSEMNGGLYKETADQAAFTSRIDLQRLSERSASFRRLQERVQSIPE